MKKTTLLGAALAALMALPAFAQTASAADLAFTCAPPTHREDGAVITAAEIAPANAYRLWEVSLTGLKGADPVATSSTCAFTLKAITGTRRYVVTVTDTVGNESGVSNMALVTTSKLRPPSSLQVRVNFVVTP